MNMKILVLDDDRFLGKALQRTFQLWGHTVTVCTQGKQALQVLATEQFDIIFSDIMMPEMDGMAFYLALQKQSPEMIDRLVFMTGAILNSNIAKWIPTQSRPVLEKPLDIAQLHAALGSVGVSSKCECQAISEVGRG